MQDERRGWNDLIIPKAPQFTMYPRQMKSVGLGSDGRPRSPIVLAPLSTQPFNPGGTSEGRSWDERGSAGWWPDGPSLENTKRVAQPTVHEGRDSVAHGGDFTVGRHNDAPHQTGPRMHGREVLVNPFDPHQHLRTRSLSGFHRDTTIDGSDTFRTAVTNH